MCLSPIQIPNKNKGLPYKMPFLLKDITSQYIYVNCGHCPECIALEQMYLVQRIQMEALDNWLFMGTVTYKNETMPRLTTSTGYEYRYTDYKDIYNMLRRLKKNNTYGIPFRYTYVTERGGKRGRPHAHFLFEFKKEDIGKSFEDAHSFAIEHEWDLFNEWKRVTKAGRYSESYALSDYRESYRYGVKHKTYDFHFVDPRLTKGGITDAAFYVLKYMMKGENAKNYGSDWERRTNQALKLNLEEDEYLETWSHIKTRKRSSLNFGLDIWNEGDAPNPKIVQWIRDGIEQSKKSSKYALYYCPEQLLTFPLAPYYKKKFLTVEDQLTWYYKEDRPGQSIDTFSEWNKEQTQALKKFTDYERKLKIIENDKFSDTVEELYNI